MGRDGAEPPRDDVELLDDVWDDDHPRAGRSPRGMLVLALLAVLAVVLVITQLQPKQLPSAGPAPSHASSHASSRSPSPSPGVTLPDSRSSTGTRPIVTKLGRPLLGVTDGWDLFIRAPGVVVRVQPALGLVTRTPLPGLSSSRPVSFLATTAGAVVWPADSVPGYLVPDGKPARLLPPGLSRGVVFAGPDPGRVWAQRDFGQQEFWLVGLDGKATGSRIRVPDDNGGWPVLADGAGYLIAHTQGGFYDLRPAGAQRITTGDLIAVGPSRWLVVECDEHNNCVDVVINRATGARRTLPRRIDTQSFWLPGAISPDGSTTVVLDQRGYEGLGLTLIDLGSGDRQVLPISLGAQDVFDSSAVAWSPDSRWLFTVDGDGRLVAVDAHTRKVHPLDVKVMEPNPSDQPDGSQLAVRSPA